MKPLPLLAGGTVAVLCLRPFARAQLAWSIFDETATTAAPASSAANGVTVTVPAGQRVTLVATNFVPIDWTSATSGNVVVTINFKVSGGGRDRHQPRHPAADRL